VTRGSNTRQTAFRLEESLLARLEAHAAHLSRNPVGIKYTLTDVVKTLLVESLERHEAKQRKGGAHSLTRTT
jgi:hypothetical protein